MNDLNVMNGYEPVLETECRAWAQVKDSLPGSSSHDRAKWEQWRMAMHAVKRILAEPTSRSPIQWQNESAQPPIVTRSWGR